MSGFVCRGHAARAVSGLILLAACFAAADDAAARVVGARPPLESGKISAVETIPPAVDPPAIDPPARFFSINRILAEHDRRIALSDAPRSVWLDHETVALARPPSPLTSASQELPSQELPSQEPFGLFTFRAPEGALWTKWRGVEAAIDEDAVTLAQCRADALHCGSPAALRFLAMIEEAQSKADGREKLDAVNRMVNSAILYTSDLVQHGVADLWSAPLATLASGRGDCEDYAIAKYVLLRESGVAVSDLRLLLVRDGSAGQDHAVLAVRDAGRWLILDNRSTIMPEASEARNLKPLFAIDREGVKLFAMPYEARLPHWRDGVERPLTERQL
jgi:predicted transglutaminase-like cysteine proteinase